MKDFVATENAMATVEFLLKETNTLEELMIATSSSHTYITINRRLNQIEKASPFAQVEITYNCIDFFIFMLWKDLLMGS